MKFFKGLLIFTSVVALAGCGGGSGGDDDDDAPRTPVVDNGGQTETAEGPPTVTTETAEGPPTEEPVVTNPITTLAPIDAVSLPPQDSAPVSSGGDFGPTADVLGFTNIAWSFEGNEDIFATTPNFRPEDVVFTDDGGAVAVDFAAQFGGIVDDQEVMFNPEIVTCQWIEVVHVCTLALSSERETLFLFDPLVNGESQGVVEFCNGSSQCVEGLLDSPDGRAVIVADGLVAKANNGTSVGDAAPYMAYAKQGVPENTKSVAERLGLDESDVQRLTSKISAMLDASKN